MFRTAAAILVLASSALGEDTLVLQNPQPFEVVQRQGFVPRQAHEHAVGGPQLGYADVPLRGTVPDGRSGPLQFRAVPIAARSDAGWTEVTPSVDAERFSATVRVPAGWHRLEIRWGKAQTAVEPFGVGEVLVVAGQSYAAGANDEILKVGDPAGRVTAFDIEKNRWQTAHDPQPNVGDGGTIWPALGDLLVPVLRVPVGFVNVAVGGTSSRQWLPGTPLYERLSKAGTRIGAFRAVLWQQGESDVIEKLSTEQYQANIAAIRTRLSGVWGRDVPWLLAKSTLHPTVYNEPEAEGRIRTAIDRLWREPGFAPGPDTDILGGEDRGGPKTRRHFTGSGQRRAPLLWFASVWNEIHRGPNGPWGVPQIVLFDKDRRCLIWGDKPAKPAPTVFMFATTLESMAKAPHFTEVGQRLAEHGFVAVAVEPPCHGTDQKPGEKPELQGWPGRCQGEDRLVAPWVARTREILDDLVKQGWTDQNRLVCAGTSRGGFMAFQFAAAEPRVKAAAAFGPVTNLLALSEFTGQEDNAVVKSLNLTNVAAKLADRGVWFSIGNNDGRVSTDDAIAFARKAAEASAKADPQKPAPVEIIVGVSLGHATPPGAHKRAAEFLRGFVE